MARKRNNKEVTLVKSEVITPELLEKELDGVTQIISLDNPFSTISKFDVKKFDVAVLTGNEVMKPYDINELLAFYNGSQTYQTCISIKANTTCGLGYFFNKDIKDLPKPMQDFLKAPTDEIGKTFSRTLVSLYTDFELFGDAYLDVVRYGKTVKFRYMPSRDMFSVQDENGYGNLVGYRSISRTDGTNTFVMSRSSIIKPFPTDGKMKDGVHYIVHFSKPSISNKFYASTNKSELHDVIRLNILSDQYNTNFFSNGGQPSWAILATGDRISPKMLSAIKENMISELKGVENSHKMLFINLPKEKADIKLVPLSKEIDAQFLSLGEKCQFRIALACQVLPKMLGLSTGGNFGGGSAAMGDLNSFIQIVSIPEQQYFQDVLNIVFATCFNLDDTYITFNCMDTSTEKDDAITHGMYFGMVDDCGNRVYDVNDVRQKLGRNPITLKTERISTVKSPITTTIDGAPESNIDLNEGVKESITNLDPDKNK